MAMMAMIRIPKANIKLESYRGVKGMNSLIIL
jgi:hypothetical protein